MVKAGGKAYIAIKFTDFNISIDKKTRRFELTVTSLAVSRWSLMHNGASLLPVTVTEAKLY